MLSPARYPQWTFEKSLRFGVQSGVLKGLSLGRKTILGSSWGVGGCESHVEIQTLRDGTSSMATGDEPVPTQRTLKVSRKPKKSRDRSEMFLITVKR